MAFSFDYRFLIAYFLVMARAVAWLMVVPPFSNRQNIPPMVTIAIASGLGFLIAPTLPPSQLPGSTAALIGALVINVLTGLAIGFVVFLLISAVTTAGSLLDLLGGLNLPTSIDPLSLDQIPVLGQFYEQIAIVLLFVSGGYLAVVDGFVRSFHAPALSLGTLGRLDTVLVVDFATYFLSGVEIAAPLLVVLFATQIVLALLTKAAPQVNVWILGMPLQVFLAMILVGLGIAVVPEFLGNLITRALGDASAILVGH